MGREREQEFGLVFVNLSDELLGDALNDEVRIRPTQEEEDFQKMVDQVEIVKPFGSSGSTTPPG